MPRPDLNLELISRRHVAMGLLSGGLAGCRGGPSTPLLINFAHVSHPPRSDDGANVGLGLDVTGRITAPVRINGRGPYRFVVDTGANRTVLSQELAAELGLADAGAAQVHGIVGVAPTRMVMVRQLQVGGVEARNIRAPTMMAAQLGVAGLLGVDLMVGRLVTLDFRRRELRIGRSRGEPGSSAYDMREEGVSPRQAAASGPGVVARARYRFGQLVIVGADVAGRRVMAFLDSGSQSTVGNLALRNQVDITGGDLRRPRFNVPLLSATGQSSSGEYGVLPLLRLGGLDISNLGAVFSDLHVFDLWGLARQPSLLIGIDVMSQFDAIELDYPRRRIVFYPRSRGRP
jgi:predicted aspartyl protease